MADAERDKTYRSGRQKTPSVSQTCLLDAGVFVVRADISLPERPLPNC